MNWRFGPARALEDAPLRQWPRFCLMHGLTRGGKMPDGRASNSMWGHYFVQANLTHHIPCSGAQGSPYHASSSGGKLSYLLVYGTPIGFLRR